MKIKLIVIGKTDKPFLVQGEEEYLKRLKRYISVERIELSDVKNRKNKSADQVKSEEGEKFLSKISNDDFVVLLDEKGKHYSSVEYSKWIQDMMNRSTKQLVFIVGGAYGFSDQMYSRSNANLSLSDMTFSHQMIRMLFLEQLYRAFTIIRNEPYHNQ